MAGNNLNLDTSVGITMLRRTLQNTAQFLAVAGAIFSAYLQDVLFLIAFLQVLLTGFVNLNEGSSERAKNDED